MLEHFAPIPILVASVCYSLFLYGTRAGRNQTGMQRAAGLALVVSGLGFATLYWATTGLGHDRDAAIRFILATILWCGLVLTINRPELGDTRRPVSPFDSHIK